VRTIAALLLATSVPSQELPPTTADIVGAGYDETVRPVLELWCTSCHEGGGQNAAAGLDLDAFPAERDAVDTLQLLRRIRERVRAGEMPPPGPDSDPMIADDRRALIGWIDGAIERHLPPVAAAASAASPGRVTVRRLSRFEYENTVRDLFGVSTARVAAFPQDDLSYGFDNIGDAMTFSALHLEKFQAAAADVAQQVAFDGDPDAVPQRRVAAETADWPEGRGSIAGSFVNLYTRGAVGTHFALERGGTYRIAVRAAGDRGGGAWPEMVIEVDGRPVKTVVAAAPRSAPEEWSVEVPLRPGRRRVDVVFTNDFYDPKGPPGDRDRNLLVEWVEVTGPLEPWTPPAGARWLTETDPGKGRVRSRARPVVRELLLRAWRRPPTAGETRRWCELVEAVAGMDGGSFGGGVQAAVEAALTSPHFLFRIEPEGSSHDLDGHALASRLSYFLWSSAPDVELLEAAPRLQRDGELERQVTRMLADPRASALARNFAGQWLELRQLDAVQPDPDRFPADPELLAAMARETEELFEHVLREDLPVRELLTADYTFANERLARHYGIGGVKGETFRRVDLPEPRRAGVLGHASVQTVTSNPTRTSPVKRGKWILENILNAPPPPPPPGADSLASEEAAVAPAAGLRAQMEAHRRSAECAVCHVRMDAFGLAMENFDAVGRFRERDEGGVIDASGALPDGTEVNGLVALRDALLRERDFERTVLHKLFVYAVGRPASPADELALEAVLMRLPSGVTLTRMIREIVAMDPFRRRSPR